MSQIITQQGMQRIPKGPIVLSDIRLKRISPHESVLYARDNKGHEFECKFEHTVHLFGSAVMAMMTFFAAKAGVVTVEEDGIGKTIIRATNAKQDGLTK